MNIFFKIKLSARKVSGVWAATFTVNLNEIFSRSQELVPLLLPKFFVHLGSLIPLQTSFK